MFTFLHLESKFIPFYHLLLSLVYFSIWKLGTKIILIRSSSLAFYKHVISEGDSLVFIVMSNGLIYPSQYRWAWPIAIPILLKIWCICDTSVCPLHIKLFLLVGYPLKKKRERSCFNMHKFITLVPTSVPNKI